METKVFAKENPQSDGAAQSKTQKVPPAAAEAGAAVVHCTVVRLLSERGPGDKAERRGLLIRSAGRDSN